MQSNPFDGSPLLYSFLSCQVIKRANGVQYGLAAVVWSENLSRTHRVSKRLQVQDPVDFDVLLNSRPYIFFNFLGKNLIARQELISTFNYHERRFKFVG